MAAASAKSPRRLRLIAGPAKLGALGLLGVKTLILTNAAGGVNGRTIKLISLDDSYSPPKAVEQVPRLVEQDEVLALFQTLPKTQKQPQTEQRIEAELKALKATRPIREMLRYQVARTRALFERGEACADQHERRADHNFLSVLAGRTRA